jgi:hypothetical protein
MEKQFIGIIISSLLYKRMKQGKEPQILSFYEEGGMSNLVIPCYFRLEDILPGQQYVLAYVRNSLEEYVKTSIPRPYVIHNRGYHWTKLAKKKIRSLQNEGIIFFNEWNRYGKFQIHEILLKSKEIKPHLPETLVFNRKNMEGMMERHHELIIKPNSGSLGKRTMKAARLNQYNWVLRYPNKNFWAEELFSDFQWPEELNKNTTTSKFIIQERISLSEYKGNPFDIRVSVQRNGTGEWQITGMVGKVAKSGSFVTNVARGGTCFTLEEIFKELPRLNHDSVCYEIERLSMMVAEWLGRNIPFLADIGLDVGITNEGFPMFIECNARDLRYSFHNANLLDNWKATYTTPITYGKYLLDLRKNQ